MPKTTKAGKVNITPAANDSPAEAAVWTILFSSMFLSLNAINIAIEITAAGILALTVIPAYMPRYAFAAPIIIESTTPKIKALAVYSGNDFSGGIYGLNSKLNTSKVC